MLLERLPCPWAMLPFLCPSLLASGSPWALRSGPHLLKNAFSSRAIFGLSLGSSLLHLDVLRALPLLRTKTQSHPRTALPLWLFPVLYASVLSQTSELPTLAPPWLLCSAVPPLQSAKLTLPFPKRLLFSIARDQLFLRDPTAVVRSSTNVILPCGQDP